MTTKRIGMLLLWVLAVLLPGGFPMMAVWMSIRAVRAKGVLAGVDAPQRLSRNSIPCPAV